MAHLRTSPRKRASATDLEDAWVAVLDYDNDGWPDLLFRTDTQPNNLYRNNGNGTSLKKQFVAGVAFTKMESPRRYGRGRIGYDHRLFRAS